MLRNDFVRGMIDMSPELDKFLCGDLAVALANVRYYLNCDARDTEGKLPPEKVHQILSYLIALENRAMELAASLSPSIRSTYFRS